MQISRRWKTLIAPAATLVAVGFVCGAAPARATPGSPGTPGPATQVWLEEFENGLVDGQLQALTDYVGADGQTYTADPYFASGAACDGMVLDGQTTDDAMLAAGCDWGGRGAIRGWASALGGGSTTNHVLANDTGTAASVPGVVLRSNPIQAPGGHYLLVGLRHYGYFCAGQKPMLGLELGYQSADHEIGDVDVCPTTANQVLQTWLPSRLPADVSAFEYVLTDAQTSSNGNDFAVDTLQVLDETPQLDQEFSRPKATVDETVTLTYTITNVTGPLGLRAKADFGFANRLPEGLVVDPGSLATTCGDGTVTESPTGTINLDDGDLSADEEACTVTATVTAHEPGTYRNDDVTVAGRGLLAPDPARVDFVAAVEPPHFVAPDTGAPGGSGDGTAPSSALAGAGVLGLMAAGGLLWRRRRAVG